MENHQQNASKSTLSIAVVVILIIAAAGIAIWYWMTTRPESKPETATTESPAEEKPQAAMVSEKLQSAPVIDYSNIEKDPTLKDIIEKRKEEYGVQDGVDMILHEDESLKIGETVVPMKEILNKIRIKKGEVAEESLGVSAWDSAVRDQTAALLDRLNDMEQRYETLRKHLQTSDSQLDKEARKKYLDELATLENVIPVYRQYKTTVKALEESRKQLDAAAPSEKEEIQRNLEILADRRNLLLKQLGESVLPGQNIAYGVHVVQSYDNIWNIHFSFLKDYFSRRGVLLTNIADEPDQGGKSTGVGRILKFSENMVYIYNVRTRDIETDLNTIHPRSKIVVFNMSEILSLLDQIDYNNINKIVFDGEILWIPAEG